MTKKTNILIYSVLEELLIYNEIKRNGFNNILIVQADFKNNDIYQYILDNNQMFHQMFLYNLCYYSHRFIIIISYYLYILCMLFINFIFIL